MLFNKVYVCTYKITDCSIRVLCIKAVLFDSRKGKAVVLFMPNVIHAHDCEKYKSGETKYFHEASFDAYCVGYGESTILLFACL